jgi:two-component system phosphate regulon sensor histidine kinase PhoR
MLLNLVGNAIKFTPRGGAITVGASRMTDGSLRLSVTDTGIGIAEEHLGKVTAPFYQVDGSLSRSSEGVGLGLSVVSNIIARHGGELILRSRVGAGTQALLVFPPQRVLTRPRGTSLAAG